MSQEIAEELKAECDRLRRENIYLRQLLKLDLYEPLTIVEEKPLNSLVENGEIEAPSIEDAAASISTLSPADKISLYRSLFRGRDDVHAIRWEGKNGRAGYSPVCANEWDRRGLS